MNNVNSSSVLLRMGAQVYRLEKTEKNIFADVRKMMRKSMSACGNGLLDLFYPRRCPICEEILAFREGRICTVCRKRLPYIKEPFCKKCGKPVGREEQELCQDCGKIQHGFVCGRSVFLYEKAFRRSVNRMKFQNRREYLDFYAEEMAKAGETYLSRWKPAVIIPVPMNRKKRRERGFDQSRLLAVRLARLTGIPVNTKSLVRIRYTLPQKDLDARQRKENLKDAFTLRKQAHIPEPVLLVDDIYTTGATIDEICKTLRKNQIRRIYFLALCTGKGK